MLTNPFRLGAAVAFALFATTSLAAQVSAPAAAVDPVIDALEGLHPNADGSFRVSNLTLKRDAATFTLTTGQVWPLDPIGGRVIGVVWRGTGRMKYDAPNPVEIERLQTRLSVPRVDTAITALVLLFTDSTLTELRRGSTPAETAAPPGVVSGLVTRFRDLLRSKTTKTWDVSFLEPVLNGRTTDMFYALVRRSQGDDLVFEIEPDDPEPVSLSLRHGQTSDDDWLEVVTQFARTDRPTPARDTRRRQVSVDRYLMDVTMPAQFDGSVGFSARTEMTLRAPDGGYGPWIPFALLGLLEIDSATWNGMPAQVAKRKDSPIVWVHAPGALEAGATPTLVLSYHGDLLERYGDWFFLKSSSGWYPRPLDGLSKAAFDITYHTPIGLPIGSVGELRDSSMADRVITTRWVHETPVRNFSFNIGRFQAFDASAPGSPPITLLWSDAGHRSLASGFSIPIIRNVKEVMTAEIASAMKFFTTLYGPPIEPRFFATEIPEGYGEAFPGLVHLSFATFMPASRPGADQVFRSHEVAHQWWGIGVDYASYRDRWLSEGLAEFSGTWYMQTRLGSMDRYLDAYRESRRDLLAVRERLGAVSLGGRLGAGRDPQDYTYGVYQKGAWTMHMLRVLMLRLSDMNEDKFTNAMREFYTTYRGRSASTEDLRHVMEKYAGADLKWFFDEWIDGTGLPTYKWAWRTEPGANGGTMLRVRVRQSEVPESFTMWVPIAVELNDGRVLRTRMRVTGPETVYTLPSALPGPVKTVRFNELEGVLAEVETEGW